MIETVAQIAARLYDLERRVSGMMLDGPVHEVDPEAQTVRLRIGGTDEEPVLSPAIPYAQMAGALKLHTPPSVGQPMRMMAPGGDWRQGLATPLAWSDDNPSPGQAGDEHVLTFGNVRMSLKGGQLTVSMGDTSVDLTESGAVISVGGTKLDLSSAAATLKAAGVTLDGATEITKSLTAGAGGTSVAATLKGSLSVTDTLEAAVEVKAPILRGTVYPE